MRSRRERPKQRASRWRRRLALGLVAYAGLAAWYRLRPQPRGIDVAPCSYWVPDEHVRFLYNMVWYEGEERQAVRQLTDAACEIIRGARECVVMDVFLFNLLHSEHGQFAPVTRQVAEAFEGKQHPSYFITDPFNTFYGTMPCPPLDWLRERGVRVGIVNTRRLRDNNMVYSPAWRLLLQWFSNGRPRRLRNPIEPRYATTRRAILEALNFKGNHRKVLIADSDDSYLTMVTSANLEDSGSYYAECGVVIRSRAVARHFLASEKAIGRISGLDIPWEIPEGPERAGKVLVTPLMGEQIKRAVLSDLHQAQDGDQVFIFMLFLADRDVIGELKRAAERGVRISLVLDQSRVSFGSKKGGFPNHFTAIELSAYPNISIRWGNTRLEEFHSKFMLLCRADHCVIHVGSANYTRRGLSGTVLEATVRLEAPADSRLSREVNDYAGWVTSGSRTLTEIPLETALYKRLWYHIQERTGLATF